MKKILITLLGSAIAGIAMAQSDINVTVTDIESDKGKIILMLFEQADGFPSAKENAFKRVKLDAKEGTVSYTFNDIPVGTYALSVAHDENDNDEIDRNFIGMPKERVGALNQTGFGKPSFNRSKFELSRATDALKLEITFLN